MTEDPAPADETPAVDPITETPETAAAPASEPGKPSDRDAGEELPDEDYVLTPEDVEDEAIRGDIVLRGAVVLLAVLLACTALRETEPLMGVASGRFYADNGFSPLTADPFALSTEPRPWKNPHWLFDLFRAGVVAVGGFSLLTVWTAAKAGGLAWQVQQVSRPGLPTWFGSVCAALMLLACLPVLLPTPEFVTLLCVGAAFWIDALARTPGREKLRWAWAALLLVETNMDGHAWFTLLVVVGLAARAAAEKLAGPTWTAAGAAAVAWLCNPFPIATLTRPLAQYRHQYQELAAYGGEEPFAGYLLQPIWFRAFWVDVSPFAVAALLLSVLALLLTLLDRRSRRPQGVLLWALANVPALACGHQWPAASVANAAIAAWAAQGYYAAEFSQVYTTKASEVLWSRAGRGLTVLSLAAVALLMLTGRMGLDDGRRLGVGLSDELAATVASTTRMIAGGGERPFHFRLEQGDLLAYAGGRNVVDHRMELFAPERTRAHRAARTQLVTGEPVPLLEELEVTAAVPRLYGPDPDYKNLLGLTIYGWKPERLYAAGVMVRPPGGAATGFFPPTIITAEADTTETESLVRPTWPQEPSVYDAVYNQEPAVSTDLMLASHYAALVRRAVANEQSWVPLERGAMTTVRLANRALSNDLNAVSGWSSLASGYAAARRVEESVGLPQIIADIRTSQELASLVQWGLCDPADPRPPLLMFALFEDEGRIDSAIAAWEEATRRLAETDESVDPPASLKQLRKDIEKVKAAVAEAAGEPAPKRAAVAVAGGCPRMAVDILEEDLTVMAGDGDAATLYAGALLQDGRFEEADAFLAINASTQAARFLRVQTALSRADYDAAEEVLETQQSELPPSAGTSFEATRMLWDVERGRLDSARRRAASLAIGDVSPQLKRVASFVLRVIGDFDETAGELPPADLPNDGPPSADAPEATP